MKQAVLVFITRSNDGVHQLLLARKKRGEIGIGKVSAPGGKIDPGETARIACTRETYEEFLISIPNNTTDLLEVAVLDSFHASSDGIYEHFMRVFIYRGGAFSGKPLETRDMHPPFWAAFEHIPYEEMYAGDDKWMPHVLADGNPRLHFSVYRRDDTLEMIESQLLVPFSELMET